MTVARILAEKGGSVITMAPHRTIDGRARDAYGTACRNTADNGWQLVPNQR